MKNSEVPLYGFSILRNGEKYDYCYYESLSSLLGLCNHAYLALGDSTDTTLERIKNLSGLHILHTHWDPALRKSGQILSQQTNIALEFLKSSITTTERAWGMYLQADEVLHQDDYATILEDIARADADGYNAVAFRYLHFWQNHNTIAIGKKWYPVEVRAIKLRAPIRSCLDAQGFEGVQRVYQSTARIYHYGHVRRPEQYALKKQAFNKLYHATDAAAAKAQAKEEKKYRKGGFLRYLGKQPLVMKERILSFGDVFTQPKVDTLILVGESLHMPVHHIQAHKIQHAKRLTWQHLKHPFVLLNPGWWERTLFPSAVGMRPQSSLGPDWEPDLRLELLLSEKNVGINNEVDE